MSYSREYVAALYARADIVEVVRAFMPLRTRGSHDQEHIACCPFHAEKTPSFVVHSRWQFYHCFACGAHGNVTRFLQEYQGMTYPKAVMWLAKRYRFYPKEWARQRRKKSKTN